MSLFGLALAVALGGPGLTNPQPQAIRVCATANAAAAPEASPRVDTDSGVPLPLTALSFRNIWAPTSPPWWRDVQYVAPPERVAVDEPLLVEVSATDSRGAPLIGALVEVAWELDGRHFRSVRRTNLLGRVSARRIIPSSCKGRRCVVAVRIAKGQIERLAYSAFVPQ
jgi:hypothetical protein